MTPDKNDAAPGGARPNRPACILCGAKPVGRGLFVPNNGGTPRWYWTCARHAPDKPGVMRLIELALLAKPEGGHHEP